MAAYLVLTRQLQPPGLCPCHAFPRECQFPDTGPTCFLISSKTLLSLMRPFLTVTEPPPTSPPHSLSLCLFAFPCYIFVHSIYEYLTHYVFYWFICLPLQGEGLLVSCSLLVPQHLEQCLARGRCSGSLLMETPPPSTGRPRDRVVCPVQPAKHQL